jgi:uncharacterized protein (DUF305 family)
MKSPLTYVVPTLLLTALTVACNKPKDNSSGKDAQPGVPPPTAEREPSKETAPYDLQFIDTMSQHHRGAIRMGEMAAIRAHHTELKEYGGKLVADQGRQVTLLEQWRDQWYAGKPNAVNRRLAGTSTPMVDINTAHFDSLSGDAFDRMFIDMMIPHHQEAVAMAKHALDKVEHAELKALSEQIIAVQQRETDMMTQWKTTWGLAP